MRVLNAEQMYSAETSQVNEGISFTRLMENAGSACARAIMNNFSPDNNVCVLCGSGKNGGDGFVIARKLAQAGYRVCIVMAFGLPKAEDAIYMREQLGIMRLVPEYMWGEGPYKNVVNGANIIVDCVFGIGYRFRENDRAKEIFDFVNSCTAKVVSIDIPSGCECESRDIPPYAIKADMTVAISCQKPVHIFKPASTLCGKTVTVKIGLDENIIENTQGERMYALTKEDAAHLFPKRNLMGNKGTFGRVIAICGSKNMQGAAVLSAKGAVMSGAGLVTACFPECAYNAIAPKLTEPLMLPLPSNLQGTFSRGAIPHLIENIKKNDAVLFGCGIGVNLETKDIANEIISNCEKPLIIDADAINAVSKNTEILNNKKAPILLTPHPGEFARLIGRDVEEIEKDRVGFAKRFCDKYGVTLLLKGANTVIVSYDRDEYYINTTGNQGLAKGGSGDMLSGIILALVGQGLPLFEAAALGAYIHGEAADRAKEKYSMSGMTASDCLNELKTLLKDYE